MSLHVTIQIMSTLGSCRKTKVHPSYSYNVTQTPPVMPIAKPIRNVHVMPHQSFHHTITILTVHLTTSPCSTRTKSHSPANTAAIFPSSVASLERRLDKLASASSLAFNASCFAFRISRLTSYSRRCFLSHLEAECLASRSCASEVGRAVAVAPSKGVEEVCGSCLAV